jgi:hypothetical protein
MDGLSAAQLLASFEEYGTQVEEHLRYLEGASAAGTGEAYVGCRPRLCGGCLAGLRCLVTVHLQTPEEKATKDVITSISGKMAEFTTRAGDLKR